MDPLLEEVAPAFPRSAGPIRRFADSTIQADIDKAIAKLEPGNRGALILHAGPEGVAFETVFSRKSGAREWSAVMVVKSSWQGRLEGEAAIRYQW